MKCGNLPYPFLRGQPLNSSNFTVIFLFVNLKTCLNIGFPKQAVGNFTDGFSVPKSFKGLSRNRPQEFSNRRNCFQHDAKPENLACHSLSLVISFIQSNKGHLNGSSVLFSSIARALLRYAIDLFTVMCLVTWPLNEGEAGVDLVMIQTSLLFVLSMMLFSCQLEKQRGFYLNKVISSISFIHWPGS